MEVLAGVGGGGGKESNDKGDDDLPLGKGIGLLGGSVEVVNLGLIGGLLVSNNAGGDALGEEGDEGSAKEHLDQEAVADGEGAVADLLLGVGGGLAEHAVAALNAGLEEDQRRVESGANAGVDVDRGATEEVEGEGHLNALLPGLNLGEGLDGEAEGTRNDAEAEGVDGHVKGALGEAEEGVLGSGGHVGGLKRYLKGCGC